MEQTLAIRNTSSGFSFTRMMELNHYFGPMFGKLLIFYFSASVIFGIVMLLPVNEYLQLADFTLIWATLPYMFAFAPLVMGKRGDSRIIERLLPVSAAEKYVYIMVYFLIVIPIAVYAVPECSLLLYKQIPALQTDALLGMIELHFGSGSAVLITNVTGSVATTLLCLYVVQHAKSSRMVKGIISVFISQFGIAMMGAIYGMAAAFKCGFADGIADAGNGTPANFEAEKVQTIVNDMMSYSPYMIAMITILALYMLTMFWLNYRQMTKDNL